MSYNSKSARLLQEATRRARERGCPTVTEMTSQDPAGDSRRDPSAQVVAQPEGPAAQAAARLRAAFQAEYEDDSLWGRDADTGARFDEDGRIR